MMKMKLTVKFSKYDWDMNNAIQGANDKDMELDQDETQSSDSSISPQMKRHNRVGSKSEV